MQYYSCRDLICCVLALGVLTSSGFAAERTHDLEAEDYFSLSTIGSVALSPDGSMIAYTEARWVKADDKRNTDLWVVDVETRKRTRLTFDSASDRGPKWSPDGRWIYFRSARKKGDDKLPYNGKTQVWRVSPSGGRVNPVTRVKDGVGQFQLSKDGANLYYTATSEHVDAEWKDLRKEFKDLKYGHGVTNFSQIWKLNLESWHAEKLVDEKRVIQDMKVASDEKRIAMLTTPDEELLSHEGWSRVDVLDTNTKEVAIVTQAGWRDEHPSPYGWLDSVEWSNDGNALAFTISFDGYSPILYAAEWDDGKASLTRLKGPKAVTITGGTVHWRGDGRDLCLRGDRRARGHVWCIQDVRGGKQGKSQMLTPEEGVASSYSFSESGNEMAFIFGTTSHTPDVFYRGRKGKFDRITNVNPQVDTWKLPQLSIVTWEGAGGDKVEGILELPPDYKPGSPLPMVVEIHGGPTSASMFSFRFWIYGRALLASKGYAVLSPNYRGSTGYGDKFLVDLIGRENDIEVEDILKGVDAMVERGIADPDRLAVMGWSNGGYLTNCLITKSTRFKAASSGAGVLDMVIQWGTEDTPGHVINYMKGLPWTVPDEYRAGSPLYNLDKVTTPTLIHVGENDPRVPPANARALYRALRHYQRIPTELVVYPGEGHGLTTYEHRKAKMKWDVAWFDRYVLGETDEKVEDMID